MHRAKKEGKKNMEGKNKIQIIQESDPKVLGTYLTLRVGKKEIDALIDTGATKSCIQEELAKELELATKNNNPTEITFGNQQKVLVKERAKISFSLESQNHIKYLEEVLLVPNLSERMVLGLPFLIKNTAITDLSAKRIKLGDTWNDMEIKTTGKTINEPDQILLKKAKILRVSEQDEMTKIIETLKQTNPPLGKIITEDTIIIYVRV